MVGEHSIWLPVGNHIKKAAQALRSGILVAMPTETVYGLGGNAEDDRAIADIYEAKGRPSFNPLIVHTANITIAARYGEFSERSLLLAQQFWPGPLTIILPRAKNSSLSHLVTAGLDTVGIRVPRHPVALELLTEADIGVAAPSANRSGRVSPTTAQHVLDEFGELLPIIFEGGACEVGLESTVCDMTTGKPVILRAGAITAEMIGQALHCEVSYAHEDADMHSPKSPGMSLSHYAPSIPVRMNAREVKPGEALLAFGMPLDGATVTENLSVAGDVKEAASNLFAMLRKLDDKSFNGIAVMPIPMDGLGVAINDRLLRATRR